jgi:hypothetical protein
MKAGSFLILLFCCISNLRLLAQSQSSPTEGIATDWANLPANNVFGDTKKTIEPFVDPWPDHIVLGEKGFIIVATGSHGQSEAFELSATGEATFVFLVSPQDPRVPTPPVWKQVTFKVSKATLGGLISSIEKAKVRDLRKKYISEVDDGCQAYFSISDGKNVRSVWMDNFFPDEFRKIIQDTAGLINSEHFSLADAVASTPKAGTDIYYQAFPKPAPTPH